MTLLIKTKIKMRSLIVNCLGSLSQKKVLDSLIEELKYCSLSFEDPIQQDVLRFSESLQFHAVYDPVITESVQKEADRLMQDLGFHGYID